GCDAIGAGMRAGLLAALFQLVPVLVEGGQRSANRISRTAAEENQRRLTHGRAGARARQLVRPAISRRAGIDEGSRLSPAGLKHLAGTGKNLVGYLLSL